MLCAKPGATLMFSCPVVHSNCFCSKELQLEFSRKKKGCEVSDIDIHALKSHLTDKGSAFHSTTEQ